MQAENRSTGWKALAPEYNGNLTRDRYGRRLVMGTCPKCKQRIRRNGNHIKLGQTWVHKICPRRPNAVQVDKPES
jgi:hypothetical protein